MYTSLIALCLGGTIFVIVKAIRPLWRSYRSPLRLLPGPPNPSFFFGQMREIFKADNSVLHEAWVEKYGPNVTYKGLLGMRRLFTVDTRALNHILTHSTDYQKPDLARENLGRLLGNGILITEGEQHRQQRRILNPAFGPIEIRELTSIFVEKAIQLRDVWASDLQKHNNEVTRVDVLSGLSKMTLDVIGLAGFNYNFDALNESQTPNELNQAFNTIFQSEGRIRLLPLLQNFIPPLRYIHDQRTRKTIQAQKVMRRIGKQLIEEKKTAIRAQMTSELDAKVSSEKGGVKRKDIGQGRDLLTLLLKANIATDIPESQRLSDEDVLAQVPTFLVAGHETTSSATTWCLFALTQAPDVQRKLRDELFSLQSEEPTMDELNSLPYLDLVVRETLRLHAPVPSTIRIATKEDVIPVSKPYTDVNGEERDGILVGKGDFILVPILAINRSKDIWGPDAHEFKPERWENLPEAVTNIPGVWGNMLTFLGGPRSCIGYRFSLVETKSLIFTLVRAFEFELAVRPEDVTKKSGLVQRPVILSEPDNGNQMPLLIRPYVHNV